MLRLRVDLAYDGAPFHGFAKQPGQDLPTVQGSLESALATLLGQPVTTTAAGRTDRGVHARAQVVHLDVDAEVERAGRALTDLDDLRRRLDRLVGSAVTIWQVRRVSRAFDARFGAQERRYRYQLADGPLLDPLRRHDVWHVGRGRLQVPAMRQGAAHLLGEHDFASLCRRAPGGHTVRRLDAITIARRGPTIQVRLRGPAFCHQLVRSIVGCLVAVGDGRHPPAWIEEVLAARDRTVAASVAPPHGLVLEGVSYGRAFPAAPPPAARVWGDG